MLECLGKASFDVVGVMVHGLHKALKAGMIEKLVIHVLKCGLTATCMTMRLSLNGIGMVSDIVAFVKTLHDMYKGSPSKMAKQIREQVKELELEQTAWKEIFVKVDETSQYLNEEVKREIEERLKKEKGSPKNQTNIASCHMYFVF